MDERDTDMHEQDGRITDALRERFPPPPFPDAELEARIRASVARRGGGVRGAGGSGTPWWSGGLARTALAAAASLLLFIGGVEYGRRTASPVSGPTPGRGGAVQLGDAASLPLTIQSAGTRWVATLARFSGEADALSPEQRRTAREVALAALYGAALELLREAGDDQMLQSVAEMVATRREAMGGGGTPSTRSF